MLGNRNAVDPHRASDVHNLLLAQILEGEIELLAHLVAHDSADADPAGLGQGFEACRDIDAVAVDVAPVPDDVAEIDAHAEPDAALFGHLGLAVGHAALDFHSAPDGIHHALEVRQEAVAGVLDHAATMLGDLRFDQLLKVRFQPLVRPLLVRPHEARIARHVGGEDRGETADRGHGSPGGKVRLTNSTAKPAAGLVPG
jgi:hypothetical protein